MQTLIVCFFKTHLLQSFIVKSQRNRVELVTRPDSGQAYTIQTGRGGRSMTIPPADKSLLGRAAPCCGSEVNVPQDLRFLTGTFTRRSARAPVLHISDVAAFVGANSNDIMPPSRIGDFRLNTDATGKRYVQ